MNNDNLESVVEDAISDVELPPDTLDAPTETDTAEPIEASPDATTDDPSLETDELQVSTPGTAPKPVQDEFEKKFGIPAQSSSGRENRIPYTRVKKITEKAVKDALDAKAKEIESGYVPTTKYQELETTVKDYTDRLTKVAEFENVMMNDAPKFLDMLSTIPAYAKIFKQLIEGAQVPAQTKTEAPADPADEMPQPDQELTDGSRVYSMEGLKALTAWTKAQARKDILGEVEKTYGPLRTDYLKYQQTQAVLPQVQAQIADARTWPLFNENEDDIVKVLQQYPQASLERAYQHVVWPKLQAEQEKLRKEVEAKSGEVKVNREAIRAEILKELKQAPRSTSVGSGQVTRPNAPTTGPRSLEDIIAEAVKTIET